MSEFFNYNKDSGSPFQPNKPISPNNLVGRHESIKKILRYAKSASEGDVQHFFLTGERGIGKTSLAKFAAYHMEKYLGTTGVYISSRGKNTLESFIDNIVNELLYFLPKNDLKEKVKGIFGKIESLELMDTKISFKSGRNKSEFMQRDFPHYINELINNINPKKGIFLVIDDISGLSETKEFVDWYKNFADTIECNTRVNLKLYILFVSYKEKFDKLVSREPSFGRIFHYEQLDSLTDFEIREFFIDTFQKRDMFCEDDALDEFIYYSQGLPLMMQQIGESTYWCSNVDKIGKSMALKGIVEAAREIGAKQLNSFKRAINEKNYEDILFKIGEFKLSHFTRYVLEENTNSPLIDSFCEDMLGEDVIRNISSKFAPEYEFNNKLVYTYFLIMANIS